jgi:hypothetical protein
VKTDSVVLEDLFPFLGGVKNLFFKLSANSPLVTPAVDISPSSFTEMDSILEQILLWILRSTDPKK